LEILNLNPFLLILLFMLKIWSQVGYYALCAHYLDIFLVVGMTIDD
jgi:hypothetical protein